MASIRKHGNGWQARVRRKGYNSQIATFDTQSEAIIWARAVEGKMDNNNFADLTEARRTTLKEAFERYKSVSLKKKGHEVEKYRIEMWRNSYLANQSLAAIRSTDIAIWRDRRLAGYKDEKNCIEIEKAKPSTVVKDLAVLSHLYTVANNEWGISVPNPIVKVAKPAVKNARDKRVLPEIEKLLLENAHPILRSSIIILIETAMRRSEFLSLYKKDINFKKRTVKLMDTKNGASRVVPLSTRAIEAISSLTATVDGRLVNWTADRLTRAFSNAAKKLSLDITLHDLRHEATSRLVECGKFNLIEIAAITGHKDMGMLKRYSHPVPEELAKRLR